MTLRFILAVALLPLGVMLSSAGYAQRAYENAVKSAEDAFGISIGRETIGLYTASNIRGFSAIDAGNVRIDGLYFDQVASLNSRVRRSTTIRVGTSSFGFPFPAPTGVVDYSIRGPGSSTELGTWAGGDTYGNLGLEADAAIPLKGDLLSLGVGASAARDAYYNGTKDVSTSFAALLRWRPATTVEILPFVSRGDLFGADAGPLYIPGGAVLPPRIDRRAFRGPRWADQRSIATNVGLLTSWVPSGSWELRTGLFRSSARDESFFTNLYLDLTPEGLAEQLIIADPPAQYASTSGEIRASRSFAEGPRLHKLYVSARGRHRTRLYGGSDEIDLGEVDIDQRQAAAKPELSFSERSRDQVDQRTIGVAYEGRWRGVGEMNLGVQKTEYRKLVSLPGVPESRIEARPWLYNANAALHVAKRFAVYAGYTTGLEESGVAPATASNRNQPLPAIRTSQREAGLRWAIKDGLTAIAGLFDVRKPYFEFGADHRFTRLGTVRNRGIELSLAGSVSDRLDIVAGALLTDPTVSKGETPVEIGDRPVNQPRQRVEVNADWRPIFLRAVSLNLGLYYIGRRPATTDNRVFLPGRVTVDLGARHEFKIGTKRAQLRLNIANVGNVYGYELAGSGVYDIIAGRVGELSLGVDF